MFSGYIPCILVPTSSVLPFSSDFSHYHSLPQPLPLLLPIEYRLAENAAAVEELLNELLGE